ncbi:cytochrome C [Bacillus sp. FJAT-27225]|uniref:cytochrome c550 n=1 Tax=Bacillus sp. FJAT-27225 TaxID=1743144 RepID=UPI00080C2F79|nr:cytochrome c [Bacillus sp. FJAT-27225]OCA91138.1 cytochrome C [Bacillus sp. FJAT-27225]
MKNPVVPFIMIMVMGIGLMFVLSFKGLGDSKDLAKGEKGGEKTEVAANPEELYEAKGCVTCHGNQLEGKGNAPKLADVGARLSEAEIKDILIKGTTGGMPGGLVQGAEADAVAKWLSEKK